MGLPPRRPPGRPRRSPRDAIKFGELVEIEIAKGEKVEAAMENVRRCQKRWGGRSKAYELWSEYQVHKANQAESDRQYRQMIADLALRLSDPKEARRVRSLLRWIAFKRWIRRTLRRP